MRWITVGLIVLGVILLVLSLFADAFGIGASGSGFGWKQLIGTIIGIGLILGGALGAWRRSPRGMEREG